ncbi:unnamed protein product, partial [Brassica rapa subsp. trilocularis]
SGGGSFALDLLVYLLFPFRYPDEVVRRRVSLSFTWCLVESGFSVCFCSGGCGVVCSTSACSSDLWFSSCGEPAVPGSARSPSTWFWTTSRLWLWIRLGSSDSSLSSSSRGLSLEALVVVLRCESSPVLLLAAVPLCLVLAPFAGQSSGFQNLSMVSPIFSAWSFGLGRCSCLHVLITSSLLWNLSPWRSSSGGCALPAY